MDSLLFAATINPLVHLNAVLNSIATVLLVLGFVLIKRGHRQAHGWVMISAFLVSCLFLVSYLTYHWTAGSVRFTHPGIVKVIYLVILLTHVVLAMTVPFLASATIAFALLGTGFKSASELTQDQRSRYLAKHRRLAHWTLPIWLYVSVTGVVVYVMLYHLWPPVA
ncbi:DUF420 domain-containing protein [Bythopirellula polymerisocia]|uniref:DUF420 domain-containing protein n=1 Tax=Bythopirellula polymerisocia TaxID=2528003 RepID=A0A5C6CHQ3_9BACT|nr:DUF420 domain-containing protein [Bythopirellula polymerisocia]TWU23555.1 hypothetical protein Pla144_37300 [Bythopirellula polymerisocia]